MLSKIVEQEMILVGGISRTVLARVLVEIDSEDVQYTVDACLGQLSDESVDDEKGHWNGSANDIVCSRECDHLRKRMNNQRRPPTVLRGRKEKS